MSEGAFGHSLHSIGLKEGTGRWYRVNELWALFRKGFACGRALDKEGRRSLALPMPRFSL